MPATNRPPQSRRVEPGALPACDYFGHDADIGVIGRGCTPEEAMERAAQAMFAIMADPVEFREDVAIEFAFDEDDLELALVTWLNSLLAETTAAGIMPATFKLAHEGNRWRGGCAGSAWRPEIERGTEVKGATLTMVAVEECDGGWEARCVVDV